MSRILTIWLPRWPVQRRLLQRPELRRLPVFVCRRERRGVMRVVSWAWAMPPRNTFAPAGWQAPGQPASPTRIPDGMSLAEAMAVLALTYGSRACHLAAIDHDDPVADRLALEDLARWCRRFAPIVALADPPPHGHTVPDCLHLDVTGTAHFFGGDERLVRTVAWTLAARGMHARAAIADTPAASRAAAHHTDMLGGTGGSSRGLPPSPPRALRGGTEGKPPQARRDAPARKMPNVPNAASSAGSPSPHGHPPSRGGKFSNLPNAASSAGSPSRRWAVVPPGEQLTALAHLPATALRIDAAVAAQLGDLGIATIGDVARLPRASLASRFAPRLAERLAQFVGERAEPLASPGFESLPVAAHAFDFPVLSRDTTLDELLAVVERLVRQCIAPLAAAGQGALGLQVRLADCGTSLPEQDATKAGRGNPRRFHRSAKWKKGMDDFFHGQLEQSRTGDPLTSRAPVVVDIGVFRPSASVPHLVELVRLRMARMRLPREIDGITVEVVSAATATCRQRTLFGTAAQTEAAQVGMLLDRLSGRLGRGAVFAPQLVADAQPEHAWAAVPPALAAPELAPPPGRRADVRTAAQGRREGWSARASAPQRRPAWLLPRPVPLETVSVIGPTDFVEPPPARFCLGSQTHDVVRAHGPERIETAWWRGPTVRRDYYVIETDTGARYWIFRRLDRGGARRRLGRPEATWFLHGTFS